MKLNPLICDGMVLQAGKPIFIAGEGVGTVAAEFAGKSYRTVADGGKWVLTLDAMPYGGPYELTISLGEERAVIRDVMVGEVYLCAGQSNMQFTIEEEAIDPPDVADGLLRFFEMDRAETYVGLRSKDGWVKCAPDNIRFWSALGFHIGANLRARAGCAVGIIGCYQGASTIQSWTDARYLTDDVFVPVADRHIDSRYPDYALWNGDSSLYASMFAPIAPYAVSDVIWYQGESNTSVSEAAVYPELLNRLIGSWREAMLDETLPFVLIQICDYGSRPDDGWRLIQQAQLDAPSRIPGVVTVVCSDVCSHENIHPPVKTALAERIGALLADRLPSETERLPSRSGR